MSLIEHAKREFKLMGYIPLDQEQEDGPNKWIQENVLELLEVFTKQGHSGFSANYCVNIFNKLARFEIIEPLTGEHHEWSVCAGDDTMLQNKRLCGVFKDKSKSDKAYYLDAIVFKNQHGATYTGSAILDKSKIIYSRQYIKFPFIPKTFYIDVEEVEVEKDSYEYYIKDPSQLDEVFKYYVKEE